MPKFMSILARVIVAILAILDFNGLIGVFGLHCAIFLLDANIILIVLGWKYGASKERV